MRKKILIISLILAVFVFQSVAQNYSICKKDSLLGLCDEKGNVIIPKVYQAIYPCQNYPNLYLVKLKNKFGILDNKNTVMLPIEYEFDIQNDNPFVIDGSKAYFDSSSMIIVKKKGKYGMLDASFKTIIPFTYDYLSYFHVYSSNAYIAKKLKNYFLIGRDQKILSKPDYIDFAGFYKFDLYPNIYAIFKTKEQKWLFVDETGKEHTKALATTQSGTDTVDIKYQPVRYNNKYAAMDYTGNMIAQGHDYISRFVNLYPENNYMYSSFAKKGKYGILRSDGQEIVKPIYSMTNPIFISGQVCKVILNGKSGIEDLNTGKEIVTPQYDDIWIYGWLKEVTWARKGGKCALLANNGNLITDFVYDEIQTYQDNLYGAKKEGKWGYIDLKGNTVISFEYDNTEGFFNETIIPLKKMGKYGYVNKEGKELTAFKYDKAERFFNKDRARIETGLQSGWIDKEGKESWE